MAQAFIPQGTFITCTNATITAPQKIGHSRSTMLTIHTRLTEPLLNIDDRKLSGCFVCKMPVKKWGGLAALCAGIVLVGAIGLCVVTGGAAAPALLAIAATISETAIVVAGVTAIGALGIVAYKTAHDCDQTLDSGVWERSHSKVIIEGQPALLNRSRMKCPTGGTLNLMLDKATAQKAARLIALYNDGEVAVQLTSKFASGMVAGATGGGTVPGIAITVGLEIWSEDSQSNQTYSLASDVGQELLNNAIDVVGNTGVEVVASAKGYEILGGLIKLNDGRLLPAQALEDGLDFLVEAEKTLKTGNDIGKHLISPEARIGYGGAVLGFAIDQGANALERGLEDLVGDTIKDLNKADEALSGQGINGGVYAIDQ